MRLAQPSSHTGAGAQEMAQKGKILVVDDDPIVRSMLQQFLHEAEFEVELATGGIQALELVHAVKPDLVLLDIEMPGMNGIETLGRLRNNPATEKLPVIFITGIPLEAERLVEILELNPDDIVTKVITSKELVARIRWVLRRYQ